MNPPPLYSVYYNEATTPANQHHRPMRTIELKRERDVIFRDGDGWNIYHVIGKMTIPGTKVDTLEEAIDLAYTDHITIKR